MTDREIDDVILDRFSRWRAKLLAERATPIITVGIAPEAGRFVVTTLEEMSDEQVEITLKAALAILDRRRRGRRPKR